MMPLHHLFHLSLRYYERPTTLPLTVVPCLVWRLCGYCNMQEWEHSSKLDDPGNCPRDNPAVLVPASMFRVRFM
jgi:hypothetical protein